MCLRFLLAISNVCQKTIFCVCIRTVENIEFLLYLKYILCFAGNPPQFLQKFEIIFAYVSISSGLLGFPVELQ